MSNNNRTYRAFYPWLVFGLSSSFLFYKYLLQVSPSVMVDELMRAFSLSGEAMGNLAAFYFYAYLAMQLPVGLLLDRFSPRYLVTGAIALCACGALIFSRAQTLGIAEIGRLFIGIGGAFSAVGTMKFVTLWFPPKRFAYVSGLMMTVGMLGAVGGEAPLSHIVEQVGWRETMFLCAAVGGVLAVIIWLFVRDKNGQVNATDTITTKPKLNIFKALQQIISKPQTWLISLYSGLAFAPISAFAGLWGVPYLSELYHLSRTDAAGLVSLTFVGFAVGSPLAGWLSDRIGRRKLVMRLGTTLGMLALLAVLYLPPFSHILLGILLFIFGFFTSYFFVSFAVVREINSPKAAATAIGFINMFNAICGALSEPFIGKLLDLGWQHKIIAEIRFFSITDYKMALLSLPVSMLIALVLLHFVNETYCKPTQ